MLVLRDPLCDCGKKACRPGSYGSHKALLLEKGTRRSLAGQGSFWGKGWVSWPGFHSHWPSEAL